MTAFLSHLHPCGIQDTYFQSISVKNLHNWITNSFCHLSQRTLNSDRCHPRQQHSNCLTTLFLWLASFFPLAHNNSFILWNSHLQNILLVCYMILVFYLMPCFGISFHFLPLTSMTMYVETVRHGVIIISSLNHLQLIKVVQVIIVNYPHFFFLSNHNRMR